MKKHNANKTLETTDGASVSPVTRKRRVRPAQADGPPHFHAFSTFGTLPVKQAACPLSGAFYCAQNDFVYIVYVMRGEWLFRNDDLLEKNTN